jgi:GAF domain-containing protein
MSKSIIIVPIISSDRLIGSLQMEDYERENAFGESELRLLTTIAASLGTALENARLFDEVQKRNQEISEALQQQTATSDVLRAMSGFQPDLRSLLEIIAENIAKVCDANDAHIYRVEGKAIKEWTHRGPIPGLEAGESLPLNRGSVIGRAILDRQIIHIHDAQVELNETEYPVSVSLQRRWGYRTVLATPLLRDGEPIGGIAIRREEVQPFTDKQIGLIETFADQAVIAIENVRLFDETQHLLNDTQQRNAELAIINSVQAGLASKLEYTDIIDLVGDKLYEIFKPDILNIAIYHPATNRTSYPYAIGLGTKRHDLPESELVGFTGEAIRERQTIVVNEDLERRMAEVGSYNLVKEGPDPQSLVYVPIIAGDEVLGVVSMQSFERGHVFPESDVRLMETLTSSMSVALQNAQSFKAEQERVAELQIINSVQEGLAKQLDFQGIIDLIGDKIREIFEADTTSVVMVDTEREWVSNIYYIERGERIPLPDGPAPRPSLGAVVVDNKKPLLIGTREEGEKLGAVPIQSPGEKVDRNESHLGVPILAGDKVIGLMTIQSYKQHAFKQDDLRLLNTLANAMSVSLENARLFDETQRLFKAEQERVAELQIINSVQEGLAKQLDFQGIIDLIGGKVREIFNADTTGVGMIDLERDWLLNVYYVDRGERIPIPDGPIQRPSLTALAMDTHKPLLFGTQEEMIKAGAVQQPSPGEMVDKNESFLGLPILSGGKLIGVISVQSYKQHAYDQDDLRLLQTLANSMSVALENARLFDETQRLLKITEDRAAELAVINSVQTALASKLDFQEIVDSVGDKLAEIFSAENVGIGFLDKTSGIMKVPYLFENGKRIENLEFPISEWSLVETVVKTRQPLMINSNIEQRPERPTPKSWLGVPIIIDDEVVGGFTVQNWEHENAFNDSDVRLLQTLAGSLGVALESARLFKAEQERVAELQIINSIQQGLASKLDFQSIIDLVGDQVRGITKAQSVFIALYDKTTDLVSWPYWVTRGQRIENLENARLFDETQRLLKETEQRAAELAIINSVQKGLASKLDMQAIYDLVGNKIRDIFQVEVVYIAIRNPADINSKTRVSSMRPSACIKITEERNAELAIINSATRNSPSSTASSKVWLPSWNSRRWLIWWVTNCERSSTLIILAFYFMMIRTTCLSRHTSMMMASGSSPQPGSRGAGKQWNRLLPNDNR